MTTVAGPSTARHPTARVRNPALNVSLYERVASLLIALLILVGAVVLLLLIAWLSMNLLFIGQKPVPVRYQQVGGGMDGIDPRGMQLDSPTEQEVAMESDLAEPEFQESVAAVIEALATLPVNLDDPALTEQEEPKRGGGKQTGTGDSPAPGSGPGIPGIPPQERWEISFERGSTLQRYARQLDFFEIELGVLEGTHQVAYAYNLSKSKPDVRRQPRPDPRLYFSWRQGELQQADRELLARAGIPAAGKIILQFYPDPVEQKLLELEENFKGRKASEIRKTRYGIRPAGGGFEFYVIDQTYL